MYKSLILTICIVPSFASAATAVLIDDKFDTPTGTASVADDVTDPTDVLWVLHGGGSTLDLGTRAGFTGRTMSNRGSSDTFRSTIGEWGAASTLDNIGDTLSYSLGFQTNNAPALPANTDAGYSFGLFDGSNAGYFFFVGVGGSTNLSLHSDDGTGNIANAYNTSGVSLLAPAVVGTSVNSNTTYAALMTLERVATGISIEATFNGTSVSFIDTSSLFTSFTTASQGSGDHSVDWWVDDVLVEYTTVPEPSTSFLTMASALLLLRRRR